MKNLSVVLITYNSAKHIQDCLTSIYKNTVLKGFEIIIVDNNSKDNTLNLISKNFENLKIIKNTKNVGFSKAANQAAKVAEGDFLLFLNPDVILKNNAIDILYEKAVKNPDISLFGGKLFDKNGKRLFSCSFVPSIKDILCLYLFNKKGCKKHFININKEQNVEIISGADFFIKKSVFMRLKGFDEDYFLYHEEVDFCRKMKLNNYKALYVPQAEFIHDREKDNIRTKFLKVYGAFLYCLKGIYLV